MAVFIGLKIERLPFSLVEMRDESNVQVRLRIMYQGLAEVQQDALSEPVFQELLNGNLLTDRLPTFLAKKITELDDDGLWRSLVLVHLCAWDKLRVKHGNGTPILFLQHRPWQKSINRYASQLGVTVIPVPQALNFRAALRDRSLRFLNTLWIIRYRPTSIIRMFLDRKSDSKSKVTSIGEPLAQEETGDQISRTPKVAVQDFGQLNVDQPQLHSDLFFWQQSSLPGRDMLLIFENPQDPLDAQKLDLLGKHQIGSAATHPGVVTIPGFPIFARPHRLKLPNPVESKWLQEQIADYHMLRSHWTSLFAAYDVKVFVTWYKNVAEHCAIADALQSLGGITTVYQRSYEAPPTVILTTNADVLFGFSQSGSDVERAANSTIQYHVTTGYLGDHRFPLLSSKARDLRSRLKEHGAKHILAYFDENSADDARWIHGHHFTRENYAFLLEKVLTEPWLGLVIKPKAPRTLRRRLGPIDKLLTEAEATGRCFLYDEGSMQGQGWEPPASAAMAADVAIHGFLHAGTAGMEAALAGVPTLMLDREGWPRSPLYRLGMGRVVFTDWESLWEACQSHWSTFGGVPGLGDWSPMLDELDPFRDGRAAERMGEYILWLKEGLQDGLDREVVMANAAERYCKQWGQDKISEVKPELHLHRNSLD